MVFLRRKYQYQIFHLILRAVEKFNSDSALHGQQIIKMMMIINATNHEKKCKNEVPFTNFEMLMDKKILVSVPMTQVTQINFFRS